MDTRTLIANARHADDFPRDMANLQTMQMSSVLCCVWIYGYSVYIQYKIKQTTLATLDTHTHTLTGTYVCLCTRSTCVLQLILAHLCFFLLFFGSWQLSKSSAIGNYTRNAHRQLQLASSVSCK